MNKPSQDTLVSFSVVTTVRLGSVKLHCLVWEPPVTCAYYKLKCSLRVKYRLELKKKKIICFIFGYAGSLLLHAGFLQLRWAGTTLCCCVQASHCGGFSCQGAGPLGVQASVAGAQGLSCPMAVMPQNCGRNCVSRFGRQILNHWTTREVPGWMSTSFFVCF